MRNLVSVVVVLLILILTSGLLLIGTTKVREAAVRMQCRNNLRQIGISLHSYNDQQGHFPMAVEPNVDLPPERRLSWLVCLEPYMEASNLQVRLDRQKGWDAEENRYLALTVLCCLRCPNLSHQPPVSTLVPTNYVGIAGVGMDAATLPLEDPRAGFFGYERKLTLGDIKEGTSTLLVAIETARTTGAWTAGGPPTVRGIEEDVLPFLGTEGQFGGTHWNGANALFGDGSVRFLRNSLDPRLIAVMATIQGSKGAGPIGEE